VLFCFTKISNCAEPLSSTENNPEAPSAAVGKPKPKRSDIHTELKYLEQKVTPEMTNDQRFAILSQKYDFAQEKNWTKPMVLPIQLEFFGNLTSEEYKLSVEFFLEDHNSQQQTHHSIANDLMIAHQVKGFMDHTFGPKETITTAELKASFEDHALDHWLDNLTKEQHKEYEQYAPTKETIYHDEMYLEDF
jgi:hypothetical protein